MTMFTKSALDLIASRADRGNLAAMIAALDDYLRAGLYGGGKGLGAERGLDIAMCRIEPRSGRLVFAGAGIDLFVVDRGRSSPSIERVRTGRGSVGSPRRSRQLAPILREFPLAGRSFILTSDGYLDQAGGPKGFGFGSARFADLALSCAESDMGLKSARFESALAEWQGDRSQRDDITVFAFEADVSEGA
jgi:serine phosphatase RsbU (regulator of sigma subunit)